MATCFVIQPFDRGEYDRRYDEVLRPAIEAAHLDPYRVDRDPSVDIPIDEIERRIREAAVCLADISEDNPNVWYETGYAVALDRPICLIAAEHRRSKYPFDIQHRRVIGYNTQSPSAFATLQSDVTQRLKLLAQRYSESPAAAENLPHQNIAGLHPHEISALEVLAESDLISDGGTWGHHFTLGMERAGWTAIAASIAIRGLIQKRLVNCSESATDWDQSAKRFTLLDLGHEWLMNNSDRLRLTRLAKPRVADTPTGVDDLPF